MAKQQSIPRGINPRQAQLGQALVEIHGHFGAGRYDQAEAKSKDLLAKLPNHPGALQVLGVIAHARGDLDSGIDYLRRAARAPAAPAMIFSNLCEMLRQKGGLAKEAEAAARRAVALNASLPEGWGNLGILLHDEGRYEEGLIALERAVALAPNFAAARNNLGNTLRKLNQPERARDEYRRAIAADERNADAHSNLASVLTELGEDAELALAEARRAIELHPKLTDAYLAAAGVEGARNRPEQALAWLDRAAGLTPDHARMLRARATVLIELDRFDDAVAATSRGVEVAPEDGDAYNAYGLALQAAGRPEEAAPAFDRAVALSAKPASALTNQASLLMEQGRGDEAIILYDRALAQQPDLAVAWFNRSDAKTFTPDDPDLATMEALLESSKVRSRDDRTRMHFALSKAWLDAGDPQRGFAHLDEGNRLKRGTFDYSAPAASDLLRRIGAAFPASLFERLAGSGDPSPQPVFVIGMPRSGTTLLEQILASHHQVVGGGELPHVKRLAHVMVGEGGVAAAYPGYVGRLGPAQLAGFGRSYLAQVAGIAGNAARVVDKMPSNFLYAGLIHLALPGARLIHVRRDPVDTCFSIYSKLFTAQQNFAYDQTELGQFHRDYQALMAHWRSVLPPGVMLEVDYEAVVDDLEGEARRMVEFIGLDWDPACLAFHQNRRSVRTASMAQVRRPVYRSSVNRWAAYATYLGLLIQALG